MLFSALVIATVLHIRSVVGDSKSGVVDIQPCSVATGVVSRSLSIAYSLNGNFSLCPDQSYQVRWATSKQSHGNPSHVQLVKQRRSPHNVLQLHKNQMTSVHWLNPLTAHTHSESVPMQFVFECSGMLTLSGSICEYNHRVPMNEKAVLEVLNLQPCTPSLKILVNCHG